MKLLLLDSNSLVNRAYYAMPALRDASGRCTGGVYGFVNMLAKLIAEEKPTHIACAFDVHAPTFRHQLYAEYKAGRHPMPEELKEQIPLLKQLLSAMGICIVELPGYEADDILGTMSKQANMPVVIVSGDKDVLQLVDDNVTVFHTKKGISEVVAYTPARLAEEGLAPWQVPELKGLMGDSSDNIKGVAGVGEKTARTLLAQYGSLDGIYEHLDEINGKLHEKLEQGKQDAYFSRDLATICRSAPIDIAVSQCVFEGKVPEAARALMVQMDFKSGLVNRFDYAESAKESTTLDVPIVEIRTADQLHQAVQTVWDDKRFCLVRVGDVWHFCLDGTTEYAVYPQADLLAELDDETVMNVFAEVLHTEGLQTLVFDGKAMYYVFSHYCGPFAVQDAMLAAYVCDANRSFGKVEDLLLFYNYDVKMAACALVRVFAALQDTMRQTQTTQVYTDIEMPLMPVLYDMEQQGFSIDVDALRCLDEKYTEELAQLTQQIYGYADGAFNINSPKQLAEVLFDKLGLPTDKKRSTGADKLERLVYLHPIIPVIMRYRQISKLQSTYVAGMMPMLDANRKLHTVFRQAVTATGRLSSTEPNLQNIPVRTPEGKQIRQAFVASAGNKLVVADYSQIELRLMAHFSQDEHMVQAYLDGQDIHAATAAKVYGVPLADVTPSMRSACKSVNFGIIYGISDFGLSENIGVSVKEARAFIDKYFQLYPGVKAFMDNIVLTAKQQGYVTTLSGRRRSIPELSSGVYNVRAFGERAAMNTPLQGTASDIIKIAMIRVWRELQRQGLRAKMILQVHDELVIDTPEDEVEQVAQLLKKEMESVYTLRVPLVADVGVGDNWVQAK